MELLANCVGKGASGCIVKFENKKGIMQYVNQDDIASIEFYYEHGNSIASRTLNNIYDIVDFLQGIKPPYITSVKAIPDHSFKRDITENFLKELSMMHKVYDALHEDEHTIRPVAVNVGSRSKELQSFGFILALKNNRKLHIIPQEFCDSGNLEHHMDEYDRTEDEHHYVDILRKTIVHIPKILHKLHAKGIIHNDVHAQNMVVCGGKVKLIDFGMSYLHGNRMDDYKSFLSTIHQLLFMLQHRDRIRDYMKQLMELVHNVNTSQADVDHMLQTILTALSHSAGGGKLTKTTEKAVIQGKTRIVYKSSRGKKYVKWNGSMVHLALLR